MPQTAASHHFAELVESPLVVSPARYVDESVAALGMLPDVRLASAHVLAAAGSGASGQLSQHVSVIDWCGRSVGRRVGPSASAGTVTVECDDDVLVVGIRVALEPDRLVDVHLGWVHGATATRAGELTVIGCGEVGGVAG